MVKCNTMLLGAMATSLLVLQAEACCHGPAGVAMVTWADSTNSEGRQSLIGDMLCLLSSLLYALYTIAIRKMLPDDCQANVAGLFGLVGLLNLVCMAPLLVLLWSASLVQLQGLTAWLVFLVICKGNVHNDLSVNNCTWCRRIQITQKSCLHMCGGVMYHRHAQVISSYYIFLLWCMHCIQEVGISFHFGTWKSKGYL